MDLDVMGVYGGKPVYAATDGYCINKQVGLLRP
jgi:hypothetical protein